MTNSTTIELFDRSIRTLEFTVLKGGAAHSQAADTVNLYIKATPDAAAYIKTIAGSVAVNVVTFDLTAVNTTIDPGVYWYELRNDTDAETLGRGIFIVHQSLYITP